MFDHLPTRLLVHVVCEQVFIQKITCLLEYKCVSFRFQSAYIQAVTVFLIVVLTLTDHLTIGDLNPKGPFLYLTSISLISFMVGLWALFVFFNITHQFELLHDYKYKQKSGLLKAIVVLVNMQVLCRSLFVI